jgi:hypothetical protein
MSDTMLIKGQEVRVIFHADGAVLDGLFPTAASVEPREAGTRLVFVAKVARADEIVRLTHAKALAVTVAIAGPDGDLVAGHWLVAKWTALDVPGRSEHVAITIESDAPAVFA